MAAALAALGRMHAALISARSDRDEKKKHDTGETPAPGKKPAVATATPKSGPDTVSCDSHRPGPEPGPLPRAAKTGGCRLPTLEMITEVCKKHKKDSGTHEVDSSLSMKLAGDLERPFGQSTGRGFSFTRFRIDHFYHTLIMRQRDAFAPCIGGQTVSLRTLCEISHLITYADPICGHLRWEEEYPFLVPNLENLGLEMDKRFGEADNRIPAFSPPFTALDNQLAPLTEEETVNIHPRLRCALLHKTGCSCRDSIAYGSLYVLPSRLPTTC